MLMDVKMRVWHGPRAFDDVVVQVEAASGDEAARRAAAKADGKRHSINSVTPSPYVEPVKKTKPVKPKAS